MTDICSEKHLSKTRKLRPSFFLNLDFPFQKKISHTVFKSNLHIFSSVYMLYVI